MCADDDAEAGKVARPPGQYRGATQEREELAVHHVQGVVLKELRWLFRSGCRTTASMPRWKPSTLTSG